MAAFQVAADALYETIAPCFFDTQQANRFGVKRAMDFLVPVAFAIWTGSYSMMPHTVFVQRLRQAIEENRFSGVGRPANQNGGKQVDHRFAPFAITIIRASCYHILYLCIERKLRRY